MKAEKGMHFQRICSNNTNLQMKKWYINKKVSFSFSLNKILLEIILNKESSEPLKIIQMGAL